MSVSGLPVFEKSGRFIGYRGVGRHITERKKAEEALRRSEAYLAEAQRLSHTGTMAFNATAPLYWSEEELRVSGVFLTASQRPAPKRETVLKRDGTSNISEESYRIGDLIRKGLPDLETVLQRIHPDDRERVNAEIEEAVLQKGDFSLEFRIELPEGTIKYVRSIGIRPCSPRMENLSRWSPRTST